MAINDLFGFLFKKSKEEKDAQKRKSFIHPTPDDGSAVVEGIGGVYGTAIDIQGQIRNEVELINKYREMELQPEVDSAIDDIVNDSIVVDNNKLPVDINLDQVEGLKKSTKDAIKEEFDNICRLLNFHNNAYDIFRRWYVDGRLYYHILIDEDQPKEGIKELRYIDPRQIRRIIETKTEKDARTGADITQIIDEYYVYTRRILRDARKTAYGNSYFPMIATSESGATQGLKISKDSIAYAHSGKVNETNSLILSHLHKAIRFYNQLRMMEDAVVIYRLTRAPERRIFYIDVGNLPTTRAEEYVRAQMTKYKTKLLYDVQTGEVRDDRRYFAMTEDYWLPRREGSQGTEISTLPGGQNLGEMEDVEYFQKALYRALNVPVSRLQSENGFNMGRASEINRDELKFAKFVDRLRRRFGLLFDTLLEKQLVLKGITSKDDWKRIREKITYDYATDSYFAESKDMEIWRERIDLLNSIGADPTEFFNKEWIQKNLLRMTEDEIADLEKSKETEKVPTPDDGGQNNE